jgi:uncharacterized protein
MRLSRYLKIYPDHSVPGRLLLYSTSKGSSVLISASTLRAIEEGTLSPTDQSTLARLGMLVPDGDGERAAMRDAISDANRISTMFRAMVVLNLDCNLACSYCYEGGLKGHSYMAPAMAELLAEVLELDHVHRGLSIDLAFYGGEPLMSTDLIVTLSSRLRTSTTAAGTDYSFSLVTNGTLLTRDTVEILLPLGLTGAKITLDGPRENHDRFRPFVSGKGSYDTIIGNLREVCDIVGITVGGNFTKDNYREFPLLLDDLLREGLTPERIANIQFSPVTKNRGDYPLPEFNDGCAATDEQWFMEASSFLREEILKRGYRTRRMAPAPCMIESSNDMVVNYDGTLFKCPAFLGRPEMSIGSLSEGIGDYAVSHGLDLWKTDDCLDCAYLPLCFGGCRLLTLLRNDAIDAVDCRRAYLDANLERFVRQDLKHQPKRNGRRH